MSGTMPIVHVVLLLLLFVVQGSMAQDFVNLTEEQYIQLRLDLIRKGIQQEDTSKILRAFAPDVSIRGNSLNGGETLARRIQAVFDISSQREMQIPKPYISREDSRVGSSNFWDFDILHPSITIYQDSAVVDCELVLWAEIASNPDKGRGRRISERFVFISPRTERRPLSNSEGIRAFEGKSESVRSSWQVVRIDRLLDFLEGCHSKSSPSEEERKEE